MKLNIDGKEYSIKFGYKPTLKARIISRVVELSNITDENGETKLEKVEDMLLFLPEFLLTGLQVHHEEFRYDYETGDGKKEQLDKAFALVEKYLDDEDGDVMELFGSLQEAMTQDSFLAGLFRKEKNKAEHNMKVEENHLEEAEQN